MSLHKKIFDLRLEKGWSQTDAAYYLDVSQPAYNKWETGQGKPTLSNLQKISEVFNIDFIDLIKEQIPNLDFSSAKFEGHSYVVNPIESTINFQSPEVFEKILVNQNDIVKLLSKQNSLFEILTKKL